MTEEIKITNDEDIENLKYEELKTSINELTDEMKELRNKKGSGIDFKAVIIILMVGFIVYKSSSTKEGPKTFQINRDIEFLEYPSSKFFKNVTKSELDSNFIKPYYLDEIFYMMNHHLLKTNKTCMSADYLNIPAKNKRLVGVLINNKRDFIAMINPIITGHENMNVTTIIKNLCKHNTTNTFTLHKSIIVKYTYYQKYLEVPLEKALRGDTYSVLTDKSTLYLQNINQFDGMVSRCLEVTINRINGFIHC